MKKREGKNGALTFRDSFNLLPMALSTLAKSFDLEEEKAWFPHLANHEGNYGRDCFPAPDEYLADGMLPEKRAKFMEWYEHHRHEPFRLEEAVFCFHLANEKNRLFCFDNSSWPVIAFRTSKS